MLPNTNRVVVVLTVIGDLVAALAPFIIDFGGSEKIVAYSATILAANAAVIQWLRGWQQYEAIEAQRELAEQADGPHAPVGMTKPE